MHPHQVRQDEADPVGGVVDVHVRLQRHVAEADQALDPLRRARGRLKVPVAHRHLPEGEARQHRRPVGELLLVAEDLEPHLPQGPHRLAPQVLGHLGYENADIETLARLVSRGRLDLSRSISEVVSLEDVTVGIEKLERQDGDPIRILVKP